MRILEIHH